MNLSLLHYEPFKLLYMVYLTAVLAIKLPFWALLSLSPSKRPRPSWSLIRCLKIYTMRVVIELPWKQPDQTLEVPDNQLKDSKFVWVEGVDQENIQGEVREWAKKARVTTTRIPGYWQFEAGTAIPVTLEPKNREKIVYHLHGGGMYSGTAHPSDMTANISRGILKHSKTITRTFAVDYRRCASTPFPAENPFPTALLDCISGYQYLVDLGFQPENIIVAGDSAGGNLALALIRYLIEYPIPKMALPRELLLLSPWGDISSSRAGPTSSLTTNMDSDIFYVVPSSKFGTYAVTSYLGSAFDRADAKTNKYLSPASAHISQTEGMFKGFPRTYILVGDAERLLDDSKAIAERVIADSPEGWVTLDIIKDAAHDILSLPWYEPEHSEALVRICRWIDQN